jgi:hypothetical protein
VPVAHAYNPSYSGSRDQEDHNSKPAWVNSSQDPILKIPNTKRAGRVAQVVDCLLNKCETLSSNPNTTKKILKIKLPYDSAILVLDI